MLRTFVDTLLLSMQATSAVIAAARKINGGGASECLFVSCLYKLRQASAAIGQFINSIPADGGVQGMDERAFFFIRDIVAGGNVALRCVTNQGSLATTAYSETVRWRVKRSIRDAPWRQTPTINQIERNNARHVQALFGRTVKRN